MRRFLNLHKQTSLCKTARGEFTIRLKRRRPFRVEQLEHRFLLSAGTLDLIFNQTGMVSTSYSAGQAQAGSVAVQPDGKIVVAGTVDSNPSEFALARYNRDGSLDSSFGTGGEVMTGFGANQPADATAVAIGPNSTIIVAGTVGSAGNQEFALARYLPSGALDPSFGTGGIVLTRFIGSAGANSVAVASGGSIVAAGFVKPQSGSGASSFAVARYLPNGSLDTTFGNQGEVTTQLGNSDAAANAVLIGPNGTIVAAGHTSTSGGDFNFALVRYTATGSLDTTFNHTGIVTTNFGEFDDVKALLLQPDGKLVAAGSYFTGSKVDLALARYNATGSLDSTFGSGGKVTTDLGGSNQAIEGLVLQPDGKLVAAGVYAPAGPSEFFLARYTTTGTPDTSFGNAGVALTSFPRSDDADGVGVILLPDGTFVIAGTSQNDFALARYWGDLSPPEYALGSADAIFVNQVYEDLLGRQVDPTGAAAWPALMARGVSRAQVVLDIEGGVEYRTRVVESLYSTYLGRPADPFGLSSFVTALGSGTTIEQVKAAILSSPEFYDRSGGTNSAFVQAVYEAVLDRPADPMGLADWLADLRAGMSRNAIGRLILTSQEAEQDLVQGYYAEFLNRSADPTGLSDWVGQLRQGMSDQALLAAIIGSDEYYQNL
jgi:uncharacterized delta-60 repeat protein